mgnify:CR=1 FL=1
MCIRDSASTAMQNYQGVPMGQSILGTQALAARNYNSSGAAIIGGVGTGLTVASGIGSIAALTAATGKVAGTAGTVIGGLAAGLGTMTAGIGLAAGALYAGGAVHAYKKRMRAIEDMRSTLEGSRLGYGLADPVTGSISNTAALDLSRQIAGSAGGAGFKGNDLKMVMGAASGLGMLSGSQSLTEVTKRVVDLAKASRDIVMLGEGISMSDAMQLQNPCFFVFTPGARWTLIFTTYFRMCRMTFVL